MKRWKETDEWGRLPYYDEDEEAAVESEEADDTAADQPDPPEMAEWSGRW